MKKLLLALMLVMITGIAWATSTTTHFSFTLPTVGASQNQWGTILNTDITNLDTYLWNATGGLTTGVNAPAAAATTITLTNPLTATQLIQFSATGQNLVLPAMNATSSPTVGATIVVKNVGSNPFTIMANDGSTSIVGSVAANQTVYLRVKTVATANGTFDVSPLAGAFTTLTASGAATLSSTLAVTSTATFSSSLSAVSVASTGAVTGSIFTLTSTTAASGNSLYSPSSNALALSTNGSVRVTIDSSGNVGIGSATPTKALDVVGTAAITGNTTIGLLANSELLTVQGTAGVKEQIKTNGTSDAILELTTTNADYGIGAGLGTTANALVIYDYTATSERMRMTATGSVGIGTTAPAYLLDVGGGARSSGYISGGTKFTTSGGGCTVTSTTGGATAGKFTTTTTGTCTTTITMNGATGMTAPNGWYCSGNDLTTTANRVSTSSSTTTAATIVVSTTSGDVVSFHCTGF